MSRKDLTGQRFGHLVVVERAASRGTKPRWRVRCDCGQEREVFGWCLARGQKSCGCVDGLTPLQRFHTNTAPANNAKGCIFWTGTMRPDGYGTLSVDGKTHRAHRWIYEQSHGPIGDLVVLHGCDEPSCVNLEHLSIGTHADNVADARSKGRQAWQKQTHCKHGHELTDENTYISPRGHRACRTCREIAGQERLPMRRKGQAMPQRGNRYIAPLPRARTVRP